MLVLTAGICLGYTARPPHYLEIQLPGGISSESVFIRYVLPGDTLGGWVQQRAGVSSYIIDTMRAGRSAAGIKALLYAPGCAIQTLDVALSDSRNEQRSFICRPLGSISIQGKLVRTDRLYGREGGRQLSHFGSPIFHAIRWPERRITLESCRFGLKTKPALSSWPS